MGCLARVGADMAHTNLLSKAISISVSGFNAPIQEIRVPTHQSTYEDEVSNLG